MINFKTLIFTAIILLFFATSIAAAEDMNITYIGFSDPSDTTYGGSSSFEVLSAYYYNERNKLSLPSDYRANINYHYINGYEQGAIEKFLSDDGYTITYNNTSVGDSGKVSVSVKNQNIVIFHMLYPGYIQKIDGSAYDDLYDDLNTAKTAATAQNRDLVFIEIQGMGSDVFDVIQDDYLELIVTRDFYMKGNSTVNVSNISADNAGEFRSLTQLMVYHLIENYASQDTLKFFTDKGMNFKKINVLYVGYDLPEAEGLGRPERYSGVFMFNRVVELLDRMLYRDYFDKITVVSYGTAPDIDVYNNTGVTTGKWWSVDTFEKNMGSNKLEDYDLIFFDGFFNDEILKDFEDVFGEINSDTNVIFNERFQYTPGSSTTYFVYRMGTTAPSGVPSRALENYPSGSNIRIGVGTSSNTQLNFDNTLDSDVVTPLVNGFLNLTMRIIDVPMRLSPPTSAAVPRESGSIWDPLTNKYFATVEDYKAWYETESGRYQPNKPYIGIFGFNVYNKQMAELASEIEKKGYNVVVGTDGIGVAPYNNLDGYFYDTVNGTSHVACFISMKNWALNYAHQPTGVDSLEILDVPVIKAVGSGGWGETTGYDANSGIPASTFTWMASASNVDGMIDFIGYNAENKEWIADRAIAWANLNQTSNANKEIAIMYYNYPPGKEDIGANYLNVMRSLAGDGAKARVTAGDSNVPISDPVYQGVLRELRADGYTVRTDKLPLVTIEQGGVYSFDYSVTDEKLILNEENLISLIYAQGINVGGYAPGVLNTMVQERIDYINDDNMSHTADTWWGCELISVSDYLKWLEHETTPKELGGNGTMDTALLLSLIQTWGEPSSFGPIPADDSPDAAWGGMIWNDKDNQIGGGADRNYIVVPMIKLGGVRLMPEPNRALASNKALDSATYHSGDLPPTHQYVAVYFWLNRGTGDSTGTGISTGFYNDENWKADAVVHFGTHGTQEWLPGTSVGLYRTHDWGPVLLPDIPNIYPYIVANVGEGLTAEYRGNAVILSHLTPPMIKTRLYDNIIDMETAIRGYQKQTATGLADAAILTAYRQIITEEVYALGWNDAFPTQFENYKKETAAELYRGGDVSKVTTADINKVTDNDVVEYLASNKNGVFDLFLENQLHNFVEAIKENSLSYGTHTYGTFNEEQIAPMVWNMWSRQGFDDVLLDTYFDDVAGIPTTNKGLTYPNGTAVPSDDINSKYTEDDILLFVEKMMSYGTVTPTADDIRIDLQSVFTKEIGSTQVKEDKIIYFLLGPSGFISDTTSYATSDDVVSAWENTYIDGESLYDLLVDELFEFYYYFSVPSALATTDSNQGTRQAANGDYLNDIEMRKAMVQFVTAVRASGSITYENVEKALASNVGFTSTGRSWYNDRMTYMMMANNRIDYGNALRDSGPSEMNALKNALSAGYISPSPGNDPVLNPHVLPTGRNFYGIDPSTYSTPAAWRVGKVMGEQLLIDYYQKYGEFPSTVSFMRFGVDFIQDEGTLEACLFYLLGCEPTWNAQGVFTGAKPVVQGDSNYDEMFKLTFKDSKGNTITVDRPRVDVVYNSAGMRDGYGSMLRYIDRAVKTVANLDNSADRSTVKNNVKANVLDMIEILKKAGLSQSEAEKLATARVFAQELGNYEIGTGNLVSASGNLDPTSPTYQDDLKAITDMYLSKMGYLYTEDNWGQSSEAITKMLQALLGRTDASIFASAGNLYDSLDNDDVFQYFGAMNMVSMTHDKDGNYISNKSLWKMPQTYIADTSNIHNYRNGDKVVYTAEEYIQKDLAARLLNPEWVQGQKEAGYSGATLMSEYIDNLYGWAVVSNGELVGQATWNRIFEAFSNDPDMMDWMSATSPYAYQSTSARMIEAIRNGYWDASSEQTTQLLQQYVQSVIESGVACCHHTCGNPAFDRFVQGQMAVLGLTPEQEEQYWEAVEKATEREKPTDTITSGTGSSSGGFGLAAIGGNNRGDDSGSDSNNDDSRENSEDGEQGGGYGLNGSEPGTPVTGYEMIPTRLSSSLQSFMSNPTFSAASIIAILIVVFVVGAVFYGSRRKGL